MPESRVPRPVRSDVQLLLQEARALEMLADEAEVPAAKLQEYWAISTDLINLVTDIEQLRNSHPDADYEQPEMLALRRRVRDIASRLSVLAMD